MAESQAKHRQTMEAKVITDNGMNERRGALYGFILALVAIVGALVLLGLGKNIVGLVALLGTLVSLAGVFIYGRWSQTGKQGEAQRAREAAAATATSIVGVRLYRADGAWDQPPKLGSCGWYYRRSTTPRIVRPQRQSNPAGVTTETIGSPTPVVTTPVRSLPREP